MEKPASAGFFRLRGRARRFHRGCFLLSGAFATVTVMRFGPCCALLLAVVCIFGSEPSFAEKREGEALSKEELQALGEFFSDYEGEYLRLIKEATTDEAWGRVIAIGEEWLACVEDGDCPDKGPNHDAIATTLSRGVLRAHRTTPLPAARMKTLAVDPLRHLESSQTPETLRTMAEAWFAFGETAEDGRSATVEAQKLLWRAITLLRSDEANADIAVLEQAELLATFIDWSFSAIARGIGEEEEVRADIERALTMGMGLSAEWDRRFEEYRRRTQFDRGNLGASAYLERAREIAGQPRNLQAAQGYFEKALKLVKTPEGRATVLFESASNLLAAGEEGDRLRALDLARQAYELDPERLEVRKIFARALLDRARVAWKQQQYGQVTDLAREGLTFEHDIPFDFQIMLAKSHAAEGNQEQALAFGRQAYASALDRLAESDEARAYITSEFEAILKQFDQEQILDDYDDERVEIQVETVPAAPSEEDRFRDLLEQAYYQRNWRRVYQLGVSYFACVKSGGCPKHSEISNEANFVIGLATLRLKQEGRIRFTPEEFLTYSVRPLIRHLKADQSEIRHRLPVLANARWELFRMTGNRKTAENALNEMWRAIEIIRAEEGHQTPVSQELANMLTGYVSFCQELAAKVDDPEDLHQRSRKAAQLGIGVSEKYDQYFARFLDEPR